MTNETETAKLMGRLVASGQIRNYRRSRSRAAQVARSKGRWRPLILPVLATVVFVMLAIAYGRMVAL